MNRRLHMAVLPYLIFYICRTMQTSSWFILTVWNSVDAILNHENLTYACVRQQLNIVNFQTFVLVTFLLRCYYLFLEVSQCLSPTIIFENERILIPQLCKKILHGKKWWSKPIFWPNKNNDSYNIELKFDLYLEY